MTTPFERLAMSPWLPTRRELLASSAAILGAVPTVGQVPHSVNRHPLSFLVIGDWGRDGMEYQRHVARQMALEGARTQAQFICSTGDNFYTLGVSSVSDRKWETSFNEIYTDWPLQKRWYPVLGNHDYGGNVHAQIERSGRCSRWGMRDRWYKVSGTDHVRPDLDLFFIDTVVWQGHEGFPFWLLGSTIRPGDQARQKKWLRDELLSSTASIKLVFGHHPIYSVGRHGGRIGLIDLDQILRRFGVTAYVNGHDHCLYHIQSSAMDYVCSGGGSQELKSFTGDRLRHGCVIPKRCDAIDQAGIVVPRWVSFIDRAGFASFTVGVNEVSFKLIDRFGVVSHESRINVRSPDLSMRIEAEV